MSRFGIESLVLAAAIGAMTSSAFAAATADKRTAGTDPNPATHYCVRNGESGACEDCWSDSKHSSAGGTCDVLKESTNAPNVKKGACAPLAHTDFCKKKQ